MRDALKRALKGSGKVGGGRVGGGKVGGILMGGAEDKPKASKKSKEELRSAVVKILSEELGLKKPKAKAKPAPKKQKGGAIPYVDFSDMKNRFESSEDEEDCY